VLHWLDWQAGAAAVVVAVAGWTQMILRLLFHLCYGIPVSTEKQEEIIFRALALKNIIKGAIKREMLSGPQVKSAPLQPHFCLSAHHRNRYKKGIIQLEIHGKRAMKLEQRIAAISACGVKLVFEQAAIINFCI
jgi:hypothetical protein